MKKKLSTTYRILLISLIIFSFGFIFPEQHKMPVQGASYNDWNKQSFWYYPWGRSGVHRGIDIFAKKGTPVLASTAGFILYSGENSMGGNVVLMLGAKWRLHYFAHMEKTNLQKIGFVDAGQKIGLVGTSGNAAGKSPHLHYSIRSLYPRFWLYKANYMYASKRMYYIDPSKYLRS